MAWVAAYPAVSLSRGSISLSARFDSLLSVRILLSAFVAVSVAWDAQLKVPAFSSAIAQPLCPSRSTWTSTPLLPSSKVTSSPIFPFSCAAAGMNACALISRNISSATHFVACCLYVRIIFFFPIVTLLGLKSAHRSHAHIGRVFPIGCCIYTDSARPF